MCITNVSTHFYLRLLPVSQLSRLAAFRSDVHAVRSSRPCWGAALRSFGPAMPVYAPSFELLFQTCHRTSVFFCRDNHPHSPVPLFSLPCLSFYSSVVFFGSD